MSKRWKRNILLLLVCTFVIVPIQSDAKSPQQPDDTKCDLYPGIPDIPAPPVNEYLGFLCGGPVNWFCDHMKYVPLVDLGSRIAIVSKRANFNYQWNPTEPGTLYAFPSRTNDETISAVNVDTWFKTTSGISNQGRLVVGAHPCGVVGGYVKWKPAKVGWSCFGDDSGPTPLHTDFPWCHKYQFSSYGQKATAANGDPAFHTQAITLWKVEGWWVAVRPCPPPVSFLPCPCAGGKVKIPYAPSCKTKNVPIRQVNAVLEPFSAPLPFQSP